MTTKTKKATNPHAWFFRYMKEHHADDEVDAIRKSIIMDYSQGKTESLKGLYEKQPRAYQKLRADISNVQKQHNTRHNKQRRKLLRLIYEFSKHGNYFCSPEVAMGIACIACGVQKLNDASEQKVIAAIKSFDDKEKNAWVTAIFKQVTDV